MKDSLIVIGAGPAGTAAAITATLAGIECVILDAQSFPRPRVGESLHPAIEPLAAQLGVADRLLGSGFERHEGIWVKWQGAEYFQRFGEGPNGAWQGFQVWRADYDAMLLERAKEVGARVLQPCRAIEPILKLGRVVGVVTSRGPLLADFVIDAAGGNHWLGRRLGMPIVPHSPRLFARFGYESTCLLADNRLPAIAADRGGWTWRAKINAGTYHFTKLSFEGEKGWSSTDGEVTRGADVSWRCVREPAGPGYFCVGDAACLVDPAAAHGVLRATMSGMLAAHEVRKIVSHPSREQYLVSEYNRWLSDWFLHDAAELRRLYSRLPTPPTWV